MFREDQMKIPSACGLIGYINRRWKVTSGHHVVSAMFVIKERSNGLSVEEISEFLYLGCLSEDVC